MKTVSLLGSGWLGFALACHFRQKQFQLKVSTRSPQRVVELEAIGVQPYLIDIDDSSSGLRDFLDSDILIVNITSKNISGFARLICAIESSRVSRLVFVSSSSVYQNVNHRVSEADGEENCESALFKLEKMFNSSLRFQTTIVRMSGLIGAARHPGHFFRNNKPVQQPDAPVNLIHQIDCVNVIDRIIEQDVWGEVFNACADTHPTKRVFYSQARRMLGLEPPLFEVSDQISFKIIDNQKVKRTLDYEFVYADLMELVSQNQALAFDL
jgi:nucleoside-diphosphate-sugar epimerase